MIQRRRQLIIGSILLILILVISIFIIFKYVPSKERMDLNEYYSAKADEVFIILEDRVYEEKAMLIDSIIYLDYDTVLEHFNKRFYWDASENMLIYTTPTEIIKADVGSKDFYVNKSKSSVEYPIVKTDGDKVYIALDYVKKYSDINYEWFEAPSRLVMHYKWGEYTFADVKKKTQLRVEPSIKSPILVDLKSGDKVRFIKSNSNEETKFTKVITGDGVIGYVKSSMVKNTYMETLSSDFIPPVYTNISKDYKINLVWHQVTNQDANNNLVNMLDGVKGINTISPTWFAVISEDGTLSSLASERYVERAHGLGLEVWGLVADFNNENKKINMFNLLSQTSRREKLENELISYAIKFDLNGINVDFETITAETGVHYVQFIRELSVKCRNNGIILSIDNYVPMPYSMYYDREEQGIVADYVITMAYDEHFSGSEVSGSVASHDFVASGITNTLKEVAPEKTIIGIPLYTRLWQEKITDDGKQIDSAAYSMDQADNFVQVNGLEPVWDKISQQYYVEYEKDGIIYKMWMEEEESIEAKMKLIHDSDVAGVAAWKLGLEKSSIWNVILKYIN